jgi:cytochrome P450
MRRAARGALPPGPPLLTPAQTLLVWRWPLVFLSRCRARYGSRFTVNIASHPPLVFLSDPADVRAMLAARADVLHPGEGAGTIEPLVGDESFMLLEGEDHLCGRRAVLPAFREGAVRENTELVRELVAREVATWPLGVAFALHGRLRALTLDTLLRTIFAGSPDPGEDELCELRDRLLEMLAITASAALPQPLLRHGPDRCVWARFLRRRGYVDELISSIIERRRRAGGGTGDLLDRLLVARNADGSAFSSRQVRDGLVSIVLAGHETTASELAWAFQLLAHNPAVQERLAEELDGGAGEAYLGATVMEVLRHRPVFLFAIPRAVKRPIEIGGWTYRPPAQLLACIYLLHHNAALFPEPEEFRPERFLGLAPDAWLPWGGGRKRCPGLHLATLEIATVLRTVLATATIRPGQRKIERPRWRSVIVTPHAGSRVVLHPRRGGRISATRHL